jgi:RHS repeat-associated protein
VFPKPKLACSVLVVIFVVAAALGQGPTTGTPPFGSFGGGPFDTVNLGNLNAHFAIPVIHKAGRGMPFTYDLSYDSSIWYPVTSSGTTTWTPVPNWGWRGVTEVATGYVSYTTTYQFGHCTQTTYTYFYHDRLGVSHNMGVIVVLGGALGCTTNWPVTLLAPDGSGYSLIMSTATTGTLTSRSGKQISAPFNATSGPGTKTDANGNQITVNNSGQFFDTLSSTTPALTVSGTAPNPTTYTYTGPSGSTHYTMNYGSYSVKTSFGCTGISEYTGNASLVSSVVLPDASQYTFTYEMSGGYYTGRLASVTLPTGGTITYAYPGAHGGIVCADGSTLELTRTTPDSSTPWTYVRSGSDPTWTTTVTDPLTNETVLNFEKDSSVSAATNNFYETQRIVKEGSNILSTTITCYNGVSVTTPSSCYNTAVASWITRTTVFRYLPTSSGSQAETDTIYDSTGHGLVKEVDDYDYGSGAVGSLIRKTLTTYGTYNGSACVALGNGIVDRPCMVTVKDNGGNTKAQTTYAYDETSVAATTGTPQHIAITGSRGNLTTASGLTSATTSLSKQFTYFDTGNLQTATDVNAAVTTLIYGACGNSFATEVDLPLTLTRHLTWDCNGAVAKTTVDENSKTTTYSYTDPHFWRLDQVSYPDGGSTTTTYNTASAPWDIATSTKQTSSTNVTTDTVFDGLGRISQTQLTSDPSGVDYVDASYDELGRLYSVSNPHRSTSSPTDGTTYYSYDALGRLTRATNPDTKYKTFSYTNRAMEFTDEAGIKKVYQSDGLGRLVDVCDGVGAGTQANGAASSACGLDIAASGFLATYAYDALGNLLNRNYSGQGSQFTYDWLSRMLSETVPEIPYVSCGGVNHSRCYTYDTVTAGDLYSSTFLNPSGTSVNAIYSWDKLHRLSTLEYSDGSNGYGYAYDASTWGTWNLSNGKGRLTSESHSNGAASAHSYDTMGRPIWEGSCAGANCYSTVRGMLHSYDYAGNVAIMTDSYGTSFTDTRNSIGQLTNVQSSWDDTTHPKTLLSAATYNPLGELSTVTYGDGLPQTNYYDSLGRLTERQVGSSPTYRLFLTYNPNSTISEFQDSVTGRWDYTYDAFNRLATASLAQTGNNSPPHYTYSYDQYGNRWQQHLVSGTGYEVDYTFNAYNKNNNFSYDYMGNVTGDGVCSPTPCWSFDYAGHLTAGNGASYLYDALGRRQQKTDVGGTVHSFVVDADGQPFDEYAPGLARVTGGFFDYEANKAEFNYLDHLGTPRLSTDYTGAVVRTEGVLMGPFGDNFTETNTSLDFTGFAGGFWDSENNGYHFGAREYIPIHGSWLSPDPAGLAAVDPSNPQTWNRYAYVANNPVSYVDPYGLNRAFPGKCNEGQGVCRDEGGGADPSTIDNGNGGTDFSAIGNSSNGCPICTGPYGSLGTAGFAEAFGDFLNSSWYSGSGGASSGDLSPIFTFTGSMVGVPFSVQLVGFVGQEPGVNIWQYRILDIYGDPIYGPFPLGTTFAEHLQRLQTSGKAGPPNASPPGALRGPSFLDSIGAYSSPQNTGGFINTQQISVNYGGTEYMLQPQIMQISSMVNGQIVQAYPIVPAVGSSVPFVQMAPVPLITW